MTNPWVSEIVEKMARAIYQKSCHDLRVPFDSLVDTTAEQYRIEARAAFLSCAPDVLERAAKIVNEVTAQKEQFQGDWEDGWLSCGMQVDARIRALMAELSPGEG